MTLYEDALDARYEYFGPGTKMEAAETGQEMKPHKTKRELYQVRKTTSRKGDIIPIAIAPCVGIACGSGLRPFVDWFCDYSLGAAVRLSGSSSLESVSSASWLCMELVQNDFDGQIED